MMLYVLFQRHNVQYIWLKGYRNGYHKEPLEQRQQEISIAKN